MKKIKEIIVREYDDRGRLIKRKSSVIVLEEDRDNEERSGFRRLSDFQRSSDRRIREAIEDYRMSEEW
jgi:hypothetical protein